MVNKPKKGTYVETILRSKQTVFSTKDIALLWNESNKTKITNRLKQYVKQKKLIRIRRSFYAKDINYNEQELATRINTPSYISFETVLREAGMIFQYYEKIFVASYLKREIKINKQIINYIKIKDYVLSNTLGIENTQGYSKASKERAFLDCIYVNKNYYFDNLNCLNWKKVFEILPIYHNKRMNKLIKEYYNNSKNKK